MNPYLLLIKTVLKVLETQLGPNKPTELASSLVDLISVTKAVYEKELGQPIDVSKIRPFEEIE